MDVIGERAMGRFSVEVELANDKDLVSAEVGIISLGEVRRTHIRGVVDSGATRLVIPASVAQQLGLEIKGNIKVRYADGHTAERPVAQRVSLTYGGRTSIFNAVVEPDRESALIGAIVLEDLDFLIDCTRQRLTPRDPDHIVSEVERHDVCLMPAR
jgi:predicted aspartyl protease